MTVVKQNNSLAAEQLGLLNATRSPDGASLIAQDRAKVRVDSLFTNLIDLRDSLRANDVRGIALAGSDLDKSVADLAETRGLVGGYGQRVDQQLERETSRALLDEKARSEMRDTDFITASSRLALLQTQLQAGLQVAAMNGSRSLLDYLS
jgi:flagellin-like hook-associated protein FlgL